MVESTAAHHELLTPEQRAKSIGTYLTQIKWAKTQRNVKTSKNKIRMAIVSLLTGELLPDIVTAIRIDDYETIKRPLLETHQRPLAYKGKLRLDLIDIELYAKQLHMIGHPKNPWKDILLDGKTYAASTERQIRLNKMMQVTPMIARTH